MLVINLLKTIDLNASKPLISLVPITSTTYCFQGQGHCYVTIPIEIPCLEQVQFGPLKKPLSTCQYRWREIRNSLPVIPRVRWGPRTRIRQTRIQSLLSVFWGERRLGIRLRRARGLMGPSRPTRPRARPNLIPNLLPPQKTLKQRLGTSLRIRTLLCRRY